MAYETSVYFMSGRTYNYPNYFKTNVSSTIKNKKVAVGGVQISGSTSYFGPSSGLSYPSGLYYMFYAGTANANLTPNTTSRKFITNKPRCVIYGGSDGNFTIASKTGTGRYWDIDLQAKDGKLPTKDEVKTVPKVADGLENITSTKCPSEINLNDYGYGLTKSDTASNSRKYVPYHSSEERYPAIIIEPSTNGNFPFTCYSSTNSNADYFLVNNERKSTSYTDGRYTSSDTLVFLKDPANMTYSSAPFNNDYLNNDIGNGKEARAITYRNCQKVGEKSEIGYEYEISTIQIGHANSSEEGTTGRLILDDVLEIVRGGFAYVGNPTDIIGTYNGFVCETRGTSLKTLIIDDYAFYRSGIKSLHPLYYSGTTSSNIPSVRCGGRLDTSAVTGYVSGRYAFKLGIPDGCFAKCQYLTEIYIPDYIQYIGKEAFYGCTNVTSITIGSGVRFIGDNAFADCTKVNTITIKSSAIWHIYGDGGGIQHETYNGKDEFNGTNSGKTFCEGHYFAGATAGINAIKMEFSCWNNLGSGVSTGTVKKLIFDGDNPYASVTTPNLKLDNGGYLNPLFTLIQPTSWESLDHYNGCGFSVDGGGNGGYGGY